MLPLTIEKIVSGGYGLVKEGEKVFFVPFVLPGEKVLVSIRSEKKNVAFCRLEGIEKPSEQRINPLCDLFGKCGGCQFQMANYSTQLEIKQAIIQEALTRIGKITLTVNPVVASEEQYGYRNKGSFQVFGNQEIGFCKPGTTIPFAIQSCPLMEKPINEKIRFFLDNENERLKLKGMKALVIRSNYEGKTINSTIKRDSFMEKVANLYFMVDVDTFFQINRFIIPKWLEYIKKLIENYKVGKGLLDLYSGVGIISQYLAPLFEKVIGIEINKRLVENGNAVLKINKINNAQFIVADASRFDELGFDYDTVIINPPRTGISPSMVKTLSLKKPRVIIYSSCNPDTFARDVGYLIQSGYQIDAVQPFDMFPQTQHTEVVGVLYRHH